MIGQLYCHLTLLSRSVNRREGQTSFFHVTLHIQQRLNRQIRTIYLFGNVILNTIKSSFFSGKTNEKYNKNNIKINIFKMFLNIIFWNILGLTEVLEGPDGSPLELSIASLF